MKLPSFSPSVTNSHPFFKSVPVLSPLAEQAAELGICPVCHKNTLVDGYEGNGMRFVKCSQCNAVIVLNSGVKGGAV